MVKRNASDEEILTMLREGFSCSHVSKTLRVCEKRTSFLRRLFKIPLFRRKEHPKTELIIYDILNSALSLREIASKHGAGGTTVRQIRDRMMTPAQHEQKASYLHKER